MINEDEPPPNLTSLSPSTELQKTEQKKKKRDLKSNLAELID